MTEVITLLTNLNGIVTAFNFGLYPTTIESIHNASVLRLVTAMQEIITVIAQRTLCFLTSLCLKSKPTIRPSTIQGKTQSGVVGVNPYGEANWQINSPTPPRRAPYHGPNTTEIKTIGKPFNENLIDGGKTTKEA